MGSPYAVAAVGRDKYTVLVTVVILSALVPTLIAQQFFRPRLEDHRTPEASATSPPEQASAAGVAPE